MMQNSSRKNRDGMETATVKNPKDKWIPWYFVAFFAVIALLDGVFVYMAVSTQTGVVTEHAYEKGLDYNRLLEAARAQPDLDQKAEYKDGVLRWTIAEDGGAPILDAFVQAHIKRPVQDGYDFDIMLKHMGGGVYEARLDAPLAGLWQARLKCKWNNQTFQTSLKFISR